MLYIFMKVSKNQLNEIQKDSKEDPSGKVKRYGLALQHDFFYPLNSSGGSRWSLRDGQGIVEVAERIELPLFSLHGHEEPHRFFGLIFEQMVQAHPTSSQSF